MFNKYSLFSLFLLLLFVSCNESMPLQTDETALPDLLVSNQLSNLRISSIAEDANGYVWIGTNRGLNRYNGDDIHQYFCNDQPNAIPDNRINQVFCDSRGTVWVTTKNGVARYTDCDDFEQIPIIQSNPRCQSIVENSRGELFVLQSNCILKYNAEKNCFEKSLLEIKEPDPYRQFAFVDEEDVLWVADQRGVIGYSTTSYNVRETLDLGSDAAVQAASLIGRHLWIALDSGLRIYDVVERKWCEVPRSISSHTLFNKASIVSISPTKGNYVMLSSAESLFLYNLRTGEFKHSQDPEFPFTTPDFTVTLFMPDSRGNLWLCSESQGFVIRHKQSALFNNPSPIVNVLVGKPVAYMSFDKHNTLWVATQNEGIYSFNVDTKQVHSFDTGSFLAHTRDANPRIYCLFVDSNDNIWVSMASKGLVQLRQKGNGLEIVSKYDIPLPIVMGEDARGNIWAGSYGNSFYSKRKSDNHFVEHHLFGNNFCYMSCMQLLKDGTFATLVRDQGLRFVNSSTLELLSPVIPDSALQMCVSRNVFLPSALKEDGEGKLWIGTVSNGLMCYDPATRTLSNVKGTPCEDIASIEVDQSGNLWVSTQYGIGKYNPETRRFTNYYSADGLGGNEFYDRVSCSLPDGTLVFGGPHGLTAFNPASMSELPESDIRLEDLKVNNRLVRPRIGAPIEKQLNLCDEVSLNSNQTSFSISFSAIDFGSEVRYNYEYKLEGFNDDWVEATGREAFYANLAPDKYNFRVRITNKDRDRVIAETGIAIVVNPPIWGVWWAKLIYVVLSLVVVGYIILLSMRARRERWTRLQNQREKEQEHRINQMNMSFFANVSHEFRTPLTVISGPLAQLSQDKAITDENRHMLQLVNRSVKRMLQLVNQMMDFHKLEDDSLRLAVRRQDIVKQLKQTAEFFAVNAKDKNITFSTQGLNDYFLMWLDDDKVDKIMNNLLGNAMKFTPTNGEVSLSLDVVSRDEAAEFFDTPDQMIDTQYAKICVTDNGPGIPAEQRENIFKRYYQLNNSHEEGRTNWGTGIGLYYARRLSLLHHGTLRVCDNPAGKGSQFCLVLPINKSSYKESELAEDKQNQVDLFPLQEEVVKAVSEQVEDSAEYYKPHLLVVDDDVEVIHYMKLLLGGAYNVTCRFDAISALETLQRQEPEVDLVISDVMMPGTNGFELCRQVKEDPQLCHIPVILVTAKTTVPDQVEGLKAGAMAYVSKPFDPEYLQALIQSLLDSRNHTRQMLQDNTQTDVLDENALSSQDNAFMTALYKLMEEELANPDMDITRMTELLHVSRSKLYYKIKGLTGENPSVFFKHYKLNRAAEMIKEGKYNISEISLLTGFSTLSHFSASFKRQFGVTPSEY